MQLLQMIYASRPFGFDSAMLAGILLDARRCNARDGVTGMLICRADLYLQLLEGPPDAVEATYRRISRDDRHTEMRPLHRQTRTDRLFPLWSMRDDPARSWFWTKAEIDGGALERASGSDILAVFQRLANDTPPAGAQA